MPVSPMRTSKECSRHQGSIALHLNSGAVALSLALMAHRPGQSDQRPPAKDILVRDTSIAFLFSDLPFRPWKMYCANEPAKKVRSP
ncbi:hypothetical protein L228DRAFT_251365 [Xylona heveae TC161]|uniref:Uncharacterized protein n=1 Tax=Xylona heveae (strain CBS 132557 / TC161) TaxID=1328760 RepID=A0A164ZLN2_XYLHT|nr:hypothetical protein L228DRAFT_251365 [Xylona heveae TC161]KZF19251.1 hypothetical protein L228DRAFT_251365 [Xylona heveae TC161]